MFKDKIDLANMLHNLAFTTSHTRDNMSLTNMSNLKNLDLVVGQAQVNAGLINISNLKNLDITKN